MTFDICDENLPSRREYVVTGIYWLSEKHTHILPLPNVTIALLYICAQTKTKQIEEVDIHFSDAPENLSYSSKSMSGSKKKHKSIISRKSFFFDDKCWPSSMKHSFPQEVFESFLCCLPNLHYENGWNVKNKKVLRSNFFFRSIFFFVAVTEINSFIPLSAEY